MRIELSPELEKLIREGIEQISHRAAARVLEQTEQLNKQLLKEVRELHKKQAKNNGSGSKEWLTVKEARSITGVTRETLWRHARSGTLKVKKEPRGSRHRVFYEAASVRALARVLKQQD